MPANNSEIRNIDIRFENNTEDEPLKLRGYAIVYDALSEPLYGDLFRERIKSGAFTKSLAQDDQVCLWGHDTRYVLGRKSAGTLILREDEKGLYFEAELPNTTWARDLKESVKRGDIKQMSFGFKVIRENWIDNKETIKEYGMPIREVEEITLHEISLVTFPAYPQTNVRDNNDIYVPKPPEPREISDDGFDRSVDLWQDRTIKYKQKIKLLKIKNI